MRLSIISDDTFSFSHSLWFSHSLFLYGFFLGDSFSFSFATLFYSFLSLVLSRGFSFSALSSAVALGKLHHSLLDFGLCFFWFSPRLRFSRFITPSASGQRRGPPFGSLGGSLPCLATFTRW